MKTGNGWRLAMGAAFGVWAASAPAFSQSLPVNNPSFESPQIPFGFPAMTVVDGWQKNPAPPPQFGITAEQWDQMAGTFPNPPAGQPRHLLNADGNQVGYLFAVPGVGFSQVTSSTYQVGVAYDLTVGIRGGGALTPGTQFEVGLAYFDANSRNVVGSRILSSTDALVSTSTLEELHVSVPAVQAGDVWAGKNIAITLTALSPNGSAGIAYWEVDNVRLSSVPEPSAVALMLVGGGAMCFVWFRRGVR